MQSKKSDKSTTSTAAGTVAAGNALDPKKTCNLESYLDWSARLRTLVVNEVLLVCLTYIHKIPHSNTHNTNAAPQIECACSSRKLPLCQHLFADRPNNGAIIRNKLIYLRTLVAHTILRIPTVEPIYLRHAGLGLN